MLETIEMNFPVLKDNELKEKIIDYGVVHEVSEGDIIIDSRSYIKVIPLVLKGTLKVIREDDEGNELFLYYIKPGETCAMSLWACQQEERSRVKAIAEEDSELLMLPIRKIDNWIQKYGSWKDFVLGTYSKRFEELLLALDDIAFHHLDERLIKYLEKKAENSGNNIIHISHQQIADELHTSREVISRLLKKMEKNEEVRLARNTITLL